MNELYISIYSMVMFDIVMDKEDMLITFEEHIRNLEKVYSSWLTIV